MPDVLIPNVPAADLARLDAQAAQLGISLDEHLRRRLHQEACRCLLYTSDAADERSSVDLGGRRII